MKRSATLAMLPLLVGCATAQVSPRPTTPTAAVTTPRAGEGFRVIAASADRDGDAYDATLLLDRAIAAMRAQHCDQAMPDLDRLVREFPDSASVFVAQYNRGLCLQRMRQWDAAADAMRAAARDPRDTDLVRDARFRLAVVGESSQHPVWVVEATDGLSTAPRLSLPDRVEADARRAAALLALDQLDDASRVADRAVATAPTPDAVAALGDDTYAALARVVLGEVTRTRAERVAIPVDTPETEDAVTRRVQLVTRAHAQYNDAIRIGNPQWAAAAGFRIGEMYRGLFESIVNAPLPADWDARARDIYRQRTRDRLRPLLQGALRSWEATLAMARRNGIQDNDWVRRAGEALDQLRALITGEPGAPAATPPARPAPTGPSTFRPAA